MNDQDGAPLNFGEEDRLPWLEPIEDYEDTGVSMSRLFGLVISGLVIIGAVVGGLWWWQNNGGRPRGELIAAPEGDYRNPAPAEPGRFDGDGDVAVAASEGVRPVGTVDPNRLPEQPIAPIVAGGPNRAHPAPAAAATRATAPARPVAAPARANATTPATASPAATGGGTIQLGAFASEATAAHAWDSLKSRFAWLGPVNRSIAAAEVNGRTVYRLRAAAGSASAARDLCARLRVAGENCIVLP
ncbi:MAG: SPOR domain-containing protein [Sphingopyxis sp.]